MKMTKIATRFYQEFEQWIAIPEATLALLVSFAVRGEIHGRKMAVFLEEVPLI
jgi:hypothetical protein